MRVLKNNIIQDQELFQKTKMSKAEQKRKLVLQEKIKKAQEEDAKVNDRRNQIRIIILFQKETISEASTVT